MKYNIIHNINRSPANLMNKFALQVPDAKSEKSHADIVVVDEEAVGEPDTPGCGAKLLWSSRGSEETQRQSKSKDKTVCSLLCSALSLSLQVHLFCVFRNMKLE